MGANLGFNKTAKGNDGQGNSLKIKKKKSQVLFLIIINVWRNRMVDEQTEFKVNLDKKKRIRIF